MTTITVTTTIQAPIDLVRQLYNTPEHIVQRNHASPDWHSPSAKNDLKVGGKFVYRMEAKDGSMWFDFTGTYDEVREDEKISYTMNDGRKATVVFEENWSTNVTIVFDVESESSEEMQRQGWQAILDNFGTYVESQAT